MTADCRPDLPGREIILGVCGGIAAYKGVEVLRLLKKEGANVRVIMTRNAREFVGPLTFAALSGRPVGASLFESTDAASIHHIEWAQGADAVIVAPATANLIGKLAGGIADDALSTFLLAVTAPVLLCPSMNTHMYAHPAVQRNLATLRRDGHMVLAPESGELACGTTGPGRLPEPAYIVDRLKARLAPQDFAGRNLLVTAGPTWEPLDPVRYVSNPSSGKMGYAIARAAEHRGARVILVSGPTALPDPEHVTVIRVKTAAQMAAAVKAHFASADVVIKAAAVSDYTPVVTADHKIKKGAAALAIDFTRTEDILMELGRRKQPSQLLVGFAAETRDLERYAAQKLVDKNLDLIVGNLVGHARGGFQSDTNAVTLFFKDGRQEALPEMSKARLAHILLDRLIAKS